MHILLVNNKPIAVSENVELLKKRVLEILQHTVLTFDFVIEPIEYLSTQE